MIREIRYARSGELSIAYQVLGSSGPDVVFVPGFVSHLDLAWEEPSFARFLRGLSGFSRLIWFDKRGTGLSDPAPEPSGIDDALDDIDAVMDAAASTRVTMLGVAVGAAICTTFALRRPGRVRALALWGAHARLLAAPGYPAEWTPSFFASVLADIDRDWATGVSVAAMNPTLAGDERYRSWFVRHARAAASPAEVRKLFELCAESDLRDVLVEISIPTLLLHRSADPWLSVEHSRYVAEHIPTAKLVELPGVDHWPWIGDMDAVLAEIEQFVTGTRSVRRRPAWGPDALTPREREVAALAVDGLAARAIADRLFIGERTAEAHIANIYAKLGVNSRVDLVRGATRLGL